MKYKTFFSLAGFLLLSVLSVFGNPGTDTPVRWRTVVKAAGGDTCTVTFKALVAPGWHLYGADIPEGGPHATVFDLSGSRGVEFTAPLKPSVAPKIVNDEMFGMQLSWWDSNVEFSAPFVVTDKADARIECRISFMSCDGESCRPPKTETVSVPVR